MSQSPHPIQIDHELERKWRRYSLWAGFATVAGLVATMIDLFHAKQFGMTGWIGFSSFALGIYFMNRNYRKNLKHYSCPVCAEKLDTPQYRPTNDNRNELAIHFDCSRCSITWDTTLREDDD
ncbi:MAG: hypothetical protein AAF085_07875 [Planctomycetota bacterium]